MIRSVSITNWKRHKELHLSFEEGVNFLVGPNGTGKTSILDAICFALLGDIEATAIYKGIDYKNLIRNPQSDMEIVLTFRPRGSDEYTVTRTQPARGNRRCTFSLDGNVLARSWDKVTANILQLYDTSDLFLRRVILLSEGDTFAYSTQPPGEGLTRHIENVLGINRMESLRGDLRQLIRDFQTEARDWRVKIEAVKQCTEEDKKKVQSLTGQLEVLQADRDKISKNVDRLNEQIGALASDMQKAEDLIGQAKSVVEEWTQIFGEPPQNHEFLGAIEALQKSLSDERTSMLAQRDSLRDELAWLAAQMESQSQILELVKPLEEEHIEVPCPVCKRPLTAKMVRDIKDECLRMLAGIEERKSEKQVQLPVINGKIQEIDTKLQKLLGIEPRVRLVLEQEPKSLSVPILESHLAKLVEQRNAKQVEVDKLKSQITEKDGQIPIIQQELNELGQKIDELKRLEMRRSLICARKGEFVSQLFHQSLESALAEQRKTLLGPLTEELSVMWSTFLGIDVGVELKDNAQIMMVDRQSGTSLEFPQLSGGEKTALLIFTQVLLCKYFSNTDFMLLDEPLEHLDSRNRWALIKFLVDTTKRGYPKQLIVTTIEETLIREYLDDTEIKINILSREYPMIEGI
jgi:exonuclease SbcC